MRKAYTAEEVAHSWDQAPDGVRAFIRICTGRMKDAPDDFVGRVGELAKLHSAIARATAATDSATQSKGIVLSAAPGAGKTSIIEELARQLRKDNVAVADLNPEDITSAESFSEAVRGQSPWSDFARLWQVGKTAGESVTVLTDKIIQLGISAGATIIRGEKTEVPDVEPITSVVEVWRKKGTPTPEQVLRMLNHSRREGCVVMIDEAQTLRELTKRNSAAEKCATKIIRSLSHPKGRRQAGINRATIIFSGLTDTREVVWRLGSPAIDPMVLAPLHHDYVADMIANRIREGTKDDAPLAEAAIEAWTVTLVPEFGDWTRHGEAAAEAAEDIVRQFGRQAVDAPWGIGAVIKLADEYRNGAYLSIRERADEEGVTDELRDLISQALWRNGNIVTKAVVTEVTRTEMERTNRKASETKILRKTEDAISRMMRCGMLDTTAHLEQHRNLNGYYCPIPTLLRYLTNPPPANLPSLLEIIGQHGLQLDEPQPGDSLFQPEWEYWTKADVAALEGALSEKKK